MPRLPRSLPAAKPNPEEEASVNIVIPITAQRCVVMAAPELLSGPLVCEERRISSFCPTGHVRYPTLSPASQAVRTDAEISTAVR
jgi:hypothetical protein